jgi:hypothetical protein
VRRRILSYWVGFPDRDGHLLVWGRRHKCPGAACPSPIPLDRDDEANDSAPGIFNSHIPDSRLVRPSATLDQ